MRRKKATSCRSPALVFELTAGMAEKKPLGPGACNVVAQERIWTEAVHREVTAARKWEERWGFIAEFDLKGAPVEKKVLPDKASFYTDNKLPHTQSQTIGASLTSSHGRTMLELEQLTCHRKRRTDIGDNYKYS